MTLARVLHDNRDPNAGEGRRRHGPAAAAARHHTHLDEAYRLLLAGNTGVLATEKDAVIDIVTRIDLIHYWDQTRKK